MQRVALKTAQAVNLAAHEPDRGEVLARYRRLRALARDHLFAAMKLVSHDALLRQARRLGLADGRTFVLDDVEELFFAYDLAIHTAPPDRLPAIDRHVRATAPPPGSEEARLLQAMSRASFAVIRIERRHPVTGLVVSDVERETELWLVDLALEQSAMPGSLLATRLYHLDDFCMTAGVIVPLDQDLLLDIFAEVPFLARKSPVVALDDRRFAEAVYRVALADGIMDRVGYQETGAAAE